jgi:hypothetical protein
MKFIIGLLFSLLLLNGCESDYGCEVPPRCNLEPDPGLCKAMFQRYYFDKASGECKQFIWGGCGGVVPFETLEECKKCQNGESSND